MRFADVSTRVNDVAQRYQVPEKLSAASQKVREGVHAAGDAAYRGAHAAYDLARAYPRTSLGGAIAAAAIIGGVLWYLFGRDNAEPVQRRRTPSRVRAGGERRRKNHRNARATA